MDNEEFQLYNTLPPHAFNQIHAATYGVNEAILIAHFQYWINKNKRVGYNFKEGRTWTYQTRKEIAANFMYFSSDQVRRVTDSLVEQGVLIKGDFNKSSIDKTIWYAFENEKMFTIGKSAKWAGESAKPIPNTKPDTIKNRSFGVDGEETRGKRSRPTSACKVAPVPPPSPPPPVKKPEKVEVTSSESETDRSIFFECLKELPLPTEEKIQLTKAYTDEQRMKDAVAFATAKGFTPANLAAVITSNYKNSRKPSKVADDAVAANKAFYADFWPLMRKVLGVPEKCPFIALNGHLEYNHEGVSALPCWNWNLYDFMEKIRAYFAKRNLWSQELDELVATHRS